MKNKKLIILIIIWILIILCEYYLFPYFVQPFVWFFTSITLLVLLIIQIKKSVQEREKISKQRLINLSFVSLFFALTFYGFYKIPREIIEKLDWIILFNKRQEIVQNVKQNSKKEGICELPFIFPIISNGGNDIEVKNNNNKTTVKFWILRGFFESPQLYFVYTEDIEEMEYIQKLIRENPDKNWKIKENWYRILERF